MLFAIKTQGFIRVAGLTADGIEMAKEMLYGIIEIVVNADGLASVRALGVKHGCESFVKGV